MFETAEDQFAVFSIMQKNGYYAPKIADKAVIDQKVSESAKILKEMNE